MWTRRKLLYVAGLALVASIFGGDIEPWRWTIIWTCGALAGTLLWHDETRTRR